MHDKLQDVQRARCTRDSHGNEGDQNFEIPSDTDLSKFQTVSIYCERFNANFGAAPLENF